VYAFSLGLLQGLRNQGFHTLMGQGALGGWRHHHQDARAERELPVRTGDFRHFLGALSAQRHLESALGRVKCREFIRLVADDGDAQGLQHLKRGGQVQNGFGARAHYHERTFTQLQQVCGYIVSWGTMYPADPTGSQHLDAGALSGIERGGDGRPTVPFARQGCAQISQAKLVRVARFC